MARDVFAVDKMSSKKRSTIQIYAFLHH